MRVKKAGKRIFGANFTAAEDKAMNMEIQRQIAVMNEKNAKEIDAIILWIIHEEFGFGHVRLKRFYKKFVKGVRELNKRYDLDYGERVWLCTNRLKEYGIDIYELADEVNRELAEEGLF